MAKIALLDVSQVSDGSRLIGNGAQTVFLEDHAVALEGSSSSNGSVMLEPTQTCQVYAEDKKVVWVDTQLSNGSAVITGAKST